MRISAINEIQLPKIMDERGNLTFAESSRHIPFAIKRIYLIYDVPGGEIRGSHSYKKLEEVIIALSGCFDLVVQDGFETKTFTLNRSYNAIYVPHGLWRTLQNFSTNALCLVLASEEYDESDYIRNYDDFLTLNREL
jgi:oxalate decarboxylase/phosphoglucose isomerase-like protein (cupin superfamily)